MSERRSAGYICVLVAGAVLLTSGCGTARDHVVDASDEASTSLVAPSGFESFDSSRCGNLTDLNDLLARSTDMDEHTLSLCGATLVADAFMQPPADVQRLQFVAGVITADELNRMAAQHGESPIAIGELSGADLRVVLVNAGSAVFEPSRSPGPEAIRATTGLLFVYRADLKSQDTGTLLINTESEFAASLVDHVSKKAG